MLRSCEKKAGTMDMVGHGHSRFSKLRRIGYFAEQAVTHMTYHKKRILTRSLCSSGGNSAKNNNTLWGSPCCSINPCDKCTHTKSKSLQTSTSYANLSVWIMFLCLPGIELVAMLSASTVQFLLGDLFPLFRFHGTVKTVATNGSP